ncbi:MAG: hypothetical protein ACRDWW_10505, partial [Acidimicrobiales bacterium]
SLGARALTGCPFDRRTRRVVRLLGARHVAQALLSGSQPARGVLALGAEVDVSHALTMLALALLVRTYRRPALASALIGTGFAAAGWGLARSKQPTRVRQGIASLSGRRDRWADRVARRTVPGYQARATDPD